MEENIESTQDNNDVHIGNEIRRYVWKYKPSITMLAEALGLHIGSISRIYRQASIQTSQLKTISEHLNYDFFAVYSASLSLKKVESIAPEEVKKTECEKLLEEKIAEVEALKKEMAYVKEINELLRRKK